MITTWAERVGRGMTQGAVVIVSGASSGIGQACAARMVLRGCRVFGFSRTPPPVGAAFEHLPVDVTNDNDVEAGVQEVFAREQRIDALINSAGYGLAGAIADTSLDEAHRQFEVNFFGCLRLCRAVLPTMQNQGSGLIVNVSSLGGLFGLPFQGLYSASKFALEGLTESLRHEVRRFGIDVVAVEPGDVRTAFTRYRVRAAASGQGSAYREQFNAALAIMERDEGQGVSAERVAALVESIWRQRHRRPRYICGHASQTVAAPVKRLLPARLFERLIADHYAARVSRRSLAGAS
jgi:short-subunit dehydrogenase